MKKLGVELNQSTLYNYEAGTVKAPDPGVLWALSKIYAVSHDEMIGLLVSVRAGNHDVSIPFTAVKNPELDDVEDQLVRTFRKARADTKRRILEFIEYQTHKEADARKPTPPPAEPAARVKLRHFTFDDESPTKETRTGQKRAR